MAYQFLQNFIGYVSRIGAQSVGRRVAKNHCQHGKDNNRLSRAGVPRMGMGLVLIPGATEVSSTSIMV